LAIWKGKGRRVGRGHRGMEEHWEGGRKIWRQGGKIIGREGASQISDLGFSGIL